MHLMSQSPELVYAPSEGTIMNILPFVLILICSSSFIETSLLFNKKKYIVISI